MALSKRAALESTWLYWQIQRKRRSIAIRPGQRLTESVDRSLVRPDFLSTRRKRRQRTEVGEDAVKLAPCGRVEVEAADEGFHLLERRFVRHQLLCLVELAGRDPLGHLDQTVESAGLEALRAVQDGELGALR